MFSYLMAFSVGVLVGCMIMGLYVALVNLKNVRDDW